MLTKVNLKNKPRPDTNKRGDEKMKEITEQEASNLIKQGKEETKKLLERGGKVIKTTIEEKDKTTTITKIEPAEGKSTSSTVIQTTNEIIINS